MNPSVSSEFIIQQLRECKNIIPQSQNRVGSTITFVRIGNQPMHKRLILFRELEDGQVSFEQSVALAARYNFLGNLLKWFEENKNWKDGAYFVVDNNTTNEEEN